MSGLALDQTSGHHLLARLTHKINHRSLQLLACKVGNDTFLFAFADSNNVYRLLGPKSVKHFVPQILLLLQSEPHRLAPEGSGCGKWG